MTVIVGDDRLPDLYRSQYFLATILLCIREGKRDRRGSSDCPCDHCQRVFARHLQACERLRKTPNLHRV